MQVSRQVQSIAERVESALKAAEEAGRTPVTLALGKEDFPAFQEWAREALGEEMGPGARYRGMPVRHLENVFLSRLELRSKPGAPNALLL
jgi:hypothetical protein